MRERANSAVAAYPTASASTAAPTPEASHNADPTDARHNSKPTPPPPTPPQTVKLPHIKNETTVDGITDADADDYLRALLQEGELADVLPRASLQANRSGSRGYGQVKSLPI